LLESADIVRLVSCTEKRGAKRRITRMLMLWRRRGSRRNEKMAGVEYIWHIRFS
jgi:hypothetical protein